MDRAHAVRHTEGWFVVWTQARAEKKVASRLRGMGFEHWLPSVTERHRWTDRWKEVVTPLFPGYLFVRGNSGHITHLLRTPGVLTLVKEGARPALLAPAFVDALRNAVGDPALQVERVDATDSYTVGDEVVVQEGPLAGVRGIVQEQRGTRRLLIWVSEVGRGVAFTIGSAMVRHVFPHGANPGAAAALVR